MPCLETTRRQRMRGKHSLGATTQCSGGRVPGKYRIPGVWAHEVVIRAMTPDLPAGGTSSPGNSGSWAPPNPSTEIRRRIMAVSVQSLGAGFIHRPRFGHAARHPCGGRGPGKLERDWIPAFAGMTAVRIGLRQMDFFEAHSGLMPPVSEW